MFFFFKQKTAYEMRISDWSSDVCSSDLQLLRNPDLLRLLGYWRSKRSGRAMPSRRDVDPTEIPWALSRIFLVDYSAQDGFRYRLAGSEIASDRKSVV